MVAAARICNAHVRARAYATSSAAQEVFNWCKGLSSVTIGHSVTSIGKVRLLRKEHCYTRAAACAVAICIVREVARGCGRRICNAHVRARAYATSPALQRAFYSVGGLKSVTIPDSVTSIGEVRLLRKEHYCTRAAACAAAICIVREMARGCGRPHLQRSRACACLCHIFGCAGSVRRLR